jgi:sorting nexin-29
MTIQEVDIRSTIIYKSSQICAYADDVAIITRTEAELKKTYKQLEKETKKLGLYVNIIKTKYMFITSKDKRNKVVNMRIGIKEFEGVNTFKYLGLLIDNQNSMTNTIK